MFVKNIRYYTGTVFEFNLPTGSTCPYAKTCKVTVDKVTGKFKNESSEYYCYASKPERFPGVRDRRWKNFEIAKSKLIVIPDKAQHIRIHASGDFFSQSYFDYWLELARSRPDIEIWAYTKSIRFWVKRLDSIPDNLELTASYGGYDDKLIAEYNLKNVKIFKEPGLVKRLPIDTNDDCARNKKIREFALIDNSWKPKK